MKQYRHLFFDLDHTLWDFEANSRNVLQILYNEFELSEKGIPKYVRFQDEFERQNLKFWRRLRRKQIKREEMRWKRFWHVLIEFRIYSSELAQAISNRYLELLPYQEALVPNAKEILEYCRDKGYQMHLLTNGFEKAQKIKIQKAGIDNYFLNIVTSQSCGAMKPDPKIFDFALKAAKAGVGESLMIGDSIEVDIVGAQRFGIDQVYFNPDLKQHVEHPTYEIRELAELKEIL